MICASMKVTALCHTCAKQHLIEFDPLIGSGSAFNDWIVKHAGHEIDFEWAERSGKYDLSSAPGAFEHYLHNADAKVAYGSSAAYTITLASLATSSTLLAGRQSTTISNTTDLYLDYLIGGKITTGTSPTADKTIELWAFGSIDDTPTFPDSFSTSDAARTSTSAYIKYASMGLVGVSSVSSTSNVAYWFKPASLAAAFGGSIPKNHGVWAVHDTAVNLNSTGGNHALRYTPVYVTVT